MKRYLANLAVFATISGCVSTQTAPPPHSGTGAVPPDPVETQSEKAPSQPVLNAAPTERIDPQPLDRPLVEPQPNITPGVTVRNGVSTRTVPRIDRSDPDTVTVSAELPDIPPGRLDVTLPPQSVPGFINTVFGDILGISFVLGEGIQDRTDQVALRSARNIEATELFDTALNALEDYGVGAYYEDGLLVFVEYEELKRTMPRFIRARARETVPTGLRPVVQYVQLVSATPNQVTDVLGEALADKRLTVKVNAGDNSLTLTGLPEAVDEALEAIDQIDIPQFSGTPVVTFRPKNWDVSELATQLSRQLQIEGYSVSTQPAAPRVITLNAIPYTNQLSIYTQYDAIREHVLNSAQRLDDDAEPSAETRRALVYKAKYYDATELAQVLESVLASMRQQEMGGLQPVNAAPQGPSPQGLDDRPGPGPATPRSGSVIVDPQGNRLVFFGTDEEYNTVLDLLRTLDTPADEVLIEVTIAEVTLTEDTRTGFEFLFDQLGSRGYAVGTRGGLGLAAGGLTGTYQSGDWIVDFSALATNNQINVLSEPRIVTKSGGAATINVGTEVPIITSQTASSVQFGGTTDILQSVQYRKTGILLDVEPIVFSDYRIDLKIAQEVSSAQDNENQAIASPVISNRNLVTELSLSDGQSAILGGLIENRFTRGQTGVPILKDFPLFGRLFRTDSIASDQTVLLIMITPYVLSSPTDRGEKLDSLRTIVDDAFFENTLSTPDTLTGIRQPMVLPRPDPLTN